MHYLQDAFVALDFMCHFLIVTVCLYHTLTFSISQAIPPYPLLGPCPPASSQLGVATAHHPPFTLQLWSHCFLDCMSHPCCMSSSSLPERSVVR